MILIFNRTFNLWIFTHLLPFTSLFIFAQSNRSMSLISKHIFDFCRYLHSELINYSIINKLLISDYLIAWRDNVDSITSITKILMRVHIIHTITYYVRLFYEIYTLGLFLIHVFYRESQEDFILDLPPEIMKIIEL